MDGQQAVDEIHRQGGPDAFEVILTDLQMPHKVPPSYLVFCLTAHEGYAVYM